MVRGSLAVCCITVAIVCGPGNRELDFLGRWIHVFGSSGADSTIIDCEFMGPGATFQSHEMPGAILDGLTIRNGLNDVWLGGGISIRNGVEGLGAEVVLVPHDVLHELDIVCSVFDPSRIEIGYGWYVNSITSRTDVNPHFCETVSPLLTPTVEGDYHVSADSPCAPPASPCGILIGTLDVGCETPAGLAEAVMSIEPRLAISPNPTGGPVRIVAFGTLVGSDRGMLDVLDASGRRVRALEFRQSTSTQPSAVWDGVDADGRPVSAGVYSVRLGGAGGTIAEG